MDKKIKARWVRALRSGKYKQGIGELRNDDGQYCCLGVLCDLYAKEKKRDFWRITRSVRKSKAEVAPGSVSKWAGLTGGTARVTIGHLNFLHNHNDAGATFAQIAKAIEEQL